MKKLFILIIVLCTTYLAWGQHAISGKPTSDKGNWVASASVFVKNIAAGQLPNRMVGIAPPPRNAHTLFINPVGGRLTTQEITFREHPNLPQYVGSLKYTLVGRCTPFYDEACAICREPGLPGGRAGSWLRNIRPKAKLKNRVHGSGNFA